MMRARPELCWKYLGEIEQACRDRQPNAGHQALAALAPRYRRFTVLTQNVDGFHRRAGSPDLIEIHGNLHRLHCSFCAYETEVADYRGLSLPPSCPYCAGLVRPRVVLFGEALPQRELERLYRVMEEGVDLVISIGTTSVFPYIAQPVIVAARRGVPTAEINPGSSEVSHLVKYRIRQGAAAALVELRDLLDGGAQAAPGPQPLRATGP
jgi:NAD-dependent deacetylase